MRRYMRTTRSPRLKFLSSDAVRDQYPGFEFHGAYRSRKITGDAFFALMRLLRFVGHLNPADSRRKAAEVQLPVQLQTASRRLAADVGIFL